MVPYLMKRLGTFQTHDDLHLIGDILFKDGDIKQFLQSKP
jgi:hypothetical protein